MARRCTCSALLAALGSDPRLRTLPLAARALWLLLAEAAVGSGGVIPFAGTARVSLLVSASETEVETLMQTLEAEALVVREAGALRIPLLEATAARAARQGAQAGGRPRRGESREAAYARRQGAILLPIGGAPSETAETTEKPPGGNRRPDDDDDDEKKNLSISHQSLPPAARGAAAVRLMARVMEIAGVDPARMPWTAHEASAWLGMGASEALVLDVVAEVMGNRRQPGPPNGPGYFTKAITKAVAEGRAAAPPPPAADAPVSPVVAWARARDAAAAAGRTLPRPEEFGLQGAA